MKRKTREKEEQEIKRYTLFQNYGYAFRWLKRVSGRATFAVTGGDILIEIVVPFLAMALPGAVAAFFTSGRKPAEILLFVLLYAGLLQAARIAQSWFKQERICRFFLFRVDCGADFYRKCLEADYQFFESTSGQKKMTAAEENLFSGNDVGVEAFLTAFVNAAISFGGLLIYAVFIGVKSMGMLLLVLVLTIVVAYADYRAGENSYSVMEKYFRKYQDFTYLKNETIASANGKDIRLYRMKQWFFGAFQTVQDQLVGLRSQELNGYFLAGILEKGLAFFRDLVIYGYLIIQMVQGNLNLSMFLLYTGIVSGFGNWMTGLFSAVSQMLQNHVRMNQYRDFMESGIMDEEEKENEKNGVSLQPGAKHEIRLEHVSFRYEGAEEDTIRDLSFTIHPGEKLALVGMNGAGKTTLIKLICGLYRPSSGKIYLDGQDVSAFSREDYWKEFAVVFQDVFAFSFSLEDNVSCMETGRLDQKRLEECLRKADLWEKASGLSKGTKTMMNKDLDEAGVTLSGGELQKLMLARALYKDAPVMILDEPTAALDPIAESEMYEKYYDMTQEKTSIFISHRLSSTRFCDRILFMENGRILEEGSHEKLMEQQGAYAHMFEVQAHYYQKKKEEEACYA